MTGRYPNGHLLIEVDEAERIATAPGAILLDARAQGYESGHIPGALPIDVKQLKDGTKPDFAGPGRIGLILKQCGVSDKSDVVVYDDGAGTLAARVFYVLEAHGLIDRVKLLNGGYTAWVAAGKPVSADTPEIVPGSASAALDSARVVAKGELQAGLERMTVLDVRTLAEYAGDDLRSNRKGGHIRGAVHKEWKEALAPIDGQGVVRFKPYDALKREYEAAGVFADRTIVPYCQGNQRGAHTYFVLRLLGYPDVRPYEGSWEEWGNAEDTEVER